MPLLSVMRLITKLVPRYDNAKFACRRNKIIRQAAGRQAGGKNDAAATWHTHFQRSCIPKAIKTSARRKKNKVIIYHAGGH